MKEEKYVKDRHHEKWSIATPLKMRAIEKVSASPESTFSIYTSYESSKETLHCQRSKV
jgi:hypothetical protein